MNENLDDLYYRILLKCDSYPERTDQMLESKSIKSLIVEKVSEEDIASVRKSLDKTKIAIDALIIYTDKLQLQQELKPMYDYLDGLSGALEKASKELANVSFDTGAVSSFFGKAVSLPQITRGAVTLATKAVDFGRGFQGAMGKIRSQLIPILKDADKEATLVNAIAADPDLDLEKIVNSVKETLKDSMGGTFLKKVGNFFNKAMSGKEKAIMSSPALDVDMGELASKIGDEIVNAKIINLLGKAPPPPPAADTVTDLADEMQGAAEAEPAPEDPDAATENPDAAEGEPEDPEAVNADLEDAVRAAKENSASPLDGALDAIDGWVGSLSNSSQKAIKGAGRLDSLKDGIKTKLDASADVVGTAVEEAILDWISQNEETLIKSKKFAKKNFDSLKTLVPKLAKFMLKQTKESSHILTKADVHRFVSSYMNRVYKQPNSLNETKEIRRWQKIAGIL